MFLVEVGNGEGAIGSGGYFPSYEYYNMALDKGWHLAPTNNQDNHKGKWGNANDARDVIITDDFSEEGIYEAIRNYRMYATEDKNLEIDYTVNGELLGAQLPDDVEQLDVPVTVSDPDASDSIAKVEIIVNSGKVAHVWDDPAELAAGQLTAVLAPDHSYYYVRVTEADGDIAVTAPVWVGEVVKLGVSSVECGTATPVTGEAVSLTTTLFNSETEDAAVTSITYAVKGGETLHTDVTGYTIPASGTLAVAWGTEQGVLYGYGGGKFGPEDPVTREQLAAMLYRYVQYKKGDTSARAGLTAFQDAAAVSAYACEAMEWAVGSGLIQGRSTTALAPGGTASRAELAAILVRFQAMKK